MSRITPKKIRDEADAVILPFIEKGLIRDQHVHSIQPRPNKVVDVGFPAGQNYSKIFGKKPYDKLYDELRVNRLFSAEFIDGGLIQMSYRFQDKALLAHRLAYYPNPNLDAFSNDPESFYQDELFRDIIERRLTAFPLRFDFDDRNAKDIVHPHSHLTLGNLQHCRIPVSSALSPRAFMEFVVRYFYDTPEHNFTALLPRHKHRFETTITAAEKELIHMVIAVPV